MNEKRCTHNNAELGNYNCYNRKGNRKGNRKDNLIEQLGILMVSGTGNLSMMLMLMKLD